MEVREPYPNEKADKFLLRLPGGLREEIKAGAAQEGRSMNSQIVQHLRAIYNPAKRQEAAVRYDTDEAGARVVDTLDSADWAKTSVP